MLEVFFNINKTMMITVFTPTYNRGYVIENLYRSLCSQTLFDFEWLIVDDGSIDATEDIIKDFIAENKITIRYFKQKNVGKHIAINKGVKEARGDLFFIVDSDDFLVETTIERLNFYYNQIKDDVTFAGVSGNRITFDGNRIGGDVGYDVIDCSPLDLRFKYHIKGDMAEAFKTRVLREYPFPVFANEKFCPEAMVWNRLSSKYCLRYFNEGIYRCEYLPDGLTAKIVQLRMQSPLASMLYYSELYHMSIPFLQKLKAAINFWRFSFCSKESFTYKIKQIGFVSLFIYPLGLLFHLKDSKK